MFDSFEQCRALFNELPLGAFIQKSDGTPVEVNPAALEIFGMGRDQFLQHRVGHPRWHLSTPQGKELTADQHPAMSAFRCRRAICGINLDIYNPRRERTLRISMDAIPLATEGGSVPSHVCVLLREITKRRRDQRRESQAALQYELLANTSMDGYWVVDLRGNIVCVNDAACRMYGYSREEMVTKTLADFGEEGGAGERRQRIMALGYDRFETVHRRKDGSQIEVEVSVTFTPGSGQFLAFLQDISSKKEAERALHESEARYRAMVQTQAEFVVRYRRGGFLTFINDTYCHYLQKERSELLGKSFYPLFFLQDREALIHCVESMNEEEQSQMLELRAWLPDGRLVWQKWNNSAILDDAGRVVEFQATGMDITRSKQAEESLRKSEERYRSLFDNMLNGFAYCRMILDSSLPLDFVFLEVNRSFERLTGLRGVSGKRISEVLPDAGSSDPELLAAFRRVALSGKPEQLEYYLCAISEWLSISVYSPEPGCFVTVFDVITKRKRTEECLAFLAHSTSNTTSEEQFFHRLARYLASTLDMDYICIDQLEDGNLWASTVAVYYNGNFEENVRYTLQDTPCGEVVGRSVCCYREGVRHLFPNDLVLQELKAESYVGVVLWGSSGVPIGLIATIGCKPLANRELAEEILQMVSGRAAAEMERRIHEEERLRLERQLLHAQKLESLGILAGGIAHDFNNILTGILGNSSLGLMRCPPDSPAVENLQNIEKGAIRAADLARQMLAYSGKGMFVVEPVNLNTLLTEMVHLLEVSISKNAQLRFELAQGLPPVQADPTQLRQIVMNLVINASEAIGDKGGTITIRSGYRHFDQRYLKSAWSEKGIKEGDFLFLQVKDSGCGMDEATLSRIFDPFFTTKFTGRGLGMSAVLGIIRGHKGAIRVESVSGQGTTFTIVLPASNLPVAVRKEEQQEAWQGSGTVLLVDDEETICDIGASMLGQLGYQVVTASSGKKALELYREMGGIRFVVLDLTMPQMDGEQTFRGLRALDPEVRVIISSGYSEQEVTRKLSGTGYLDFIQKPYNMQALSEVMKRCDRQDGVSRT